MDGAVAPHAEHHAEHTPHGWRRWLLSTDHKDIGTLAMVGGVIGGAPPPYRQFSTLPRIAAETH